MTLENLDFKLHFKFGYWIDTDDDKVNIYNRREIEQDLNNLKTIDDMYNMLLNNLKTIVDNNYSYIYIINKLGLNAIAIVRENGENNYEFVRIVEAL